MSKTSIISVLPNLYKEQKNQENTDLKNSKFGKGKKSQNISEYPIFRILVWEVTFR